MSEILSAAPQSGRANPQEGAGDRRVSSSENILVRTRANAPANDAILHGRVRLCRSCGCETTADRICPDCADAMREERAEALSDLCRRHGVTCIEAVPREALVEHQRAWGRY